jgi:hypothetical protein
LKKRGKMNAMLVGETVVAHSRMLVVIRADALQEDKKV